MANQKQWTAATAARGLNPICSYMAYFLQKGSFKGARPQGSLDAGWPKDHANIRIPQTMVDWASEPECRIRKYMWSLEPYGETPKTRGYNPKASVEASRITNLLASCSLYGFRIIYLNSGEHILIGLPTSTLTIEPKTACELQMMNRQTFAPWTCIGGGLLFRGLAQLIRKTRVHIICKISVEICYSYDAGTYTYITY